MLVWILFVGTYLFFLIYPVIRCGIVKKRDFINKDFCKECMAVCLLFFIVGIVIYGLISSERFVYCWDYGVYYRFTINIKNTYVNDPLRVLASAYQTSVNTDYGDWVCAIIGWPFQFTKCRYVDYIILLYITFAIPVSVSISGLAVSFCKRKRKYQFFVCECITLLCPWFLMPLLYGYPGIAALLPAACSLWILAKIGMDRLKICDAVVLSLALIFSALLRRYFSFWIVGFVAASVVFSVSYWLKNKEGKQEIKRYIIGFFKVGIISLMIMLLCMHGFIQRVLFTDYAGQYVGYNVGNMLTKYKEFLIHWGILMAALFMAAIIFIVMKQKSSIPVILFCISFLIMVTFGFYRIQSPGLHHYWVFLIPLLLPIEIFVVNSMEIKLGIMAVSCLCILYNSAYVYTGSFLDYHSLLCQQDRYEIRKRNDMEQLADLCSYLESIQGTSRIYSIASGMVFNHDILNKFYLPDDCKLNLAGCSDADLRDGFCTDFFDSGIILTTSPPETHLQEGTQQVVTILQAEFENQTSQIAEHFEKVRDFTLDYDVTVHVYRKISEFEPEDISYLQRLFDEVYPNHKDLFYDRFEMYLQGLQ